MRSVYCACILAVGLVSSYPAKFSQSTTVTIASSLKPPFDSCSSWRIWNARVAGKAEPLRTDQTDGKKGGFDAHEDSMMIRSGWYWSVGVSRECGCW